MKTITRILAIVFILLGYSLFASGTDTKSGSVAGSSSTFAFNKLAPVTPSEATFDDNTADLVFPVDVMALAPLTPVNAEFEDPESTESIILPYIAPITPAEADFNDLMTPLNEADMLAPPTPCTADFNDTI